MRQHNKLQITFHSEGTKSFIPNVETHLAFAIPFSSKDETDHVCCVGTSIKQLRMSA